MKTPWDTIAMNAWWDVIAVIGGLLLFVIIYCGLVVWRMGRGDDISKR